jgi:phage baseplate assembly protein W
MYSIAFPDMFSTDGVTTKLSEDHIATYENLRLVLLSPKGSLLGDPDFGSMLYRKFFEQNTPILRDLIIDDIYSTIQTFIPQLVLKRTDITVESDGVDVFAKITCTNLIDYELDTYNINLTTDSV